MAIETTRAAEGRSDIGERVPVIDTDVHAVLYPGTPMLLDRLSERWRDYMKLIGPRLQAIEIQVPKQRLFTHRADTVPPNGIPGTDEAFARMQLLDEYDICAGIMNLPAGMSSGGGATMYPPELQLEICRAQNDWYVEEWMAKDDRWWGAISLPFELPGEAVKEIERVKSGPFGERFVQIMVERRSDYPIGNVRYWPMLEACEHFGLPVAFHTGANRTHTACGPANYYFEEHIDFAISNFTQVSSIVFNGVFERFPGLKFVMTEQNWSWGVPYMWRLDGAWRKLRAEVPHLQRRPSEYVKEHFYFTTQPMEEPENSEDYKVLYELFQEHGLGEHLMYSSDYFHWDFDAPEEAVPVWMPHEWRRKILGENASKLYGIPLREGTGVPATRDAVAT